WPRHVARVWACVAVGAALHILTDPDGRARWPALCAVSLAAVAVTHIITVFIITLFGALAVVALLVTGPGPRARAWLRLAVAVGAAIGLSAYWGVPFAAHRNLQD